MNRVFIGRILGHIECGGYVRFAKIRRRRDKKMGTETATANVPHTGSKSELLNMYLNALESIISNELATPTLANARSAPDGIRRFDLMDALDQVAAARIELDGCPEGANLAFLAASIEQHRLRPPAESSRSITEARSNGRSAQAMKNRAS